MKRILIIAALAMGLAAQQARAITINFANDPGSGISFSGGTFTFIDTPGVPAPLLHQFDISSVAGGVGDSIGAQGRIVPGTFAFTAPVILGPIQTSTVTGPSSTIELYDVAFPVGGPKLTATVDWIDITTLGTGGTINLTGVVNLSNITYPVPGGPAPIQDYIDLAASGVGSAVITFQFTPAVPSTTLYSAVTPIVTSFSGTLQSSTVPDAGATLSLLSLGVMSLAAIGRKRLI